MLFWGVREMKRVQLLTVDSPRADIEIAGAVVSSKKIDNIDKNSNFDNPVTYIDVVSDHIYCSQEWGNIFRWNKGHLICSSVVW